MTEGSNPLLLLGDRSPQGRVNARRCLKNCVFVSHSGKDWPFIEEHIETTLTEALSVATYTTRDGTWCYPYGIFCHSYPRLGTAYVSTVNIALAECRAFVLILSRNSMQSNWVKKELLYAEGRLGQILTVSVDGTSFEEFVSALGLPDIFKRGRSVLSVHITGGIPNQTTNLLAVATQYLRSRYRTTFGMRRPLGNPVGT